MFAHLIMNTQQITVLQTPTILALRKESRYLNYDKLLGSVKGESSKYTFFAVRYRKKTKNLLL